MNAIILSSLVLFSSINAFAQGSACLGKFCIGSEILDTYDRAGKVVGFDQAKNEVYYTRNGYSSPDTSAPSSLALKIVSATYTSGKNVIDSYDRIGKVVAAYDNGKIAYQRTSYSSTDISQDLSVEVSEHDGIRAETLVIDSYDRIGNAKMIFADGRIAYQRTSYSSLDITRSLTPAVASLGAISAGTVVLDSYDRMGTVVATFRDGRIQYQRTSYSSTDISRELTPAVTTYGDFTTGTTVIDEYDRIGTVNQVFADGRVRYTRTSYSSTDTTRASSLSAKSDATASGIKAGMLAIDEYDRVGTVNMTFKNGKISFRRESYSSNDIVMKVSREVETKAAGYSKSTEYATDGGMIGKPIHFFENGKIQVESATGSKRTADSLSPEVESLADLKKGDQILLISLESYPVERIFQNRTVVISSPESDTENAPLVKTSFIILEDSRLADSAQQWIAALSNDYGSLNYFRSEGLAIKKALYPQLRAKIVELLDSRKSDLSKKEKRAVLAQLPETL